MIRRLDHVAVAVADTDRAPSQVRIECTEIKFEEDVDGNRGWLDD
ncbi:MAG TPA: hypothetical protein VGL78_19030 [Solirubrobacteraceae bacterium]|jgi:hypothetical protein